MPKTDAAFVTAQRIRNPSFKNSEKASSQFWEILRQNLADSRPEMALWMACLLRKKLLMLAKHIMTRDVVTVRPTMSIKDLAKILIQNQISGAPVVDKAGKVLGIVSEADIVRKKARQVRNLMTKKVISIEEETPVEKIARLMTVHKLKRVPVVRGHKVVGIVSRADIVGAIAMGKHIALHTPIYDL